MIALVVMAELKLQLSALELIGNRFAKVMDWNKTFRYWTVSHASAESHYQAFWSELQMDGDNTFVEIININ